MDAKQKQAEQGHHDVKGDKHIGPHQSTRARRQFLLVARGSLCLRASRRVAREILVRRRREINLEYPILLILPPIARSTQPCLHLIHFVPILPGVPTTILTVMGLTMSVSTDPSTTAITMLSLTFPCG